MPIFFHTLFSAYSTIINDYLLVIICVQNKSIFFNADVMKENEFGVFKISYINVLLD